MVRWASVCFSRPCPCHETGPDPHPSCSFSRPGIAQLAGNSSQRVLLTADQWDELCGHTVAKPMDVDTDEDEAEDPVPGEDEDEDEDEGEGEGEEGKDRKRTRF